MEFVDFSVLILYMGTEAEPNGGRLAPYQRASFSSYGSHGTHKILLIMRKRIADVMCLLSVHPGAPHADLD